MPGRPESVNATRTPPPAVRAPDAAPVARHAAGLTVEMARPAASRIDAVPSVTAPDACVPAAAFSPF